MGILDAPGLALGKARLLSLYNRLTPATTLAVPPVAPAVDLPTVTWSTTSQFALPYQVGAVHSGAITQTGLRGTWDNSFSRVTSGPMGGLDFYHEGTTTLEVHLQTPNGGGGTYWIWVNGAPTTAQPVDLTGQPSGSYYVQLTFPSVATRRIEFFGASAVANWYDVRSGLAALLTPAPRKPVVGFVGDSYWGGLAPGTGSSVLQSGAFLLSRLLGVECLSQSFGGTGWANGGAGSNPYAAAARVAGIAAGNPELIIFMGSVNDDGLANTQSAMQAGLAAYQAACPNAKAICFGPQPTGAASTLTASRQANVAANRAAALSMPAFVLAWHDMIGIADGIPATWTSGTSYADGSLATTLGSVWQAVCPGGTVSGFGVNAPGPNSRWNLVTYSMYGTGYTGTSRTFADGVTNSTTALTSATANFVAGDVGAVITGAGIPAGTTIASRQSATAVTLSQAATATATGVSVAITNGRNDGTRDTFVYSDNVHPMPAASKALSIKEATAIRADLRAAAGI